jgi:hypothetical protein
MKYFLATLLFSITVTVLAQARPDNHQAILRNSTQESRVIPFADFEALIDAEKQEFEVRGLFTLGSTSDGINIFKEDVSFAVGTYSRTIPAGAFKPEAERGKLRYDEVTKEGSLTVKIRIAGNNKFTIKIEAEGVKVPKDLKAEDVTLKIGDDGGGRARPGAKKSDS